LYAGAEAEIMEITRGASLDEIIEEIGYHRWLA